MTNPLAGFARKIQRLLDWSRTHKKDLEQRCSVTCASISFEQEIHQVLIRRSAMHSLEEKNELLQRLDNARERLRRVGDLWKPLVQTRARFNLAQYV